MLFAPASCAEILQYVELRAERRMDNFEYWKSGFIHYHQIINLMTRETYQSRNSWERRINSSL